MSSLFRFLAFLLLLAAPVATAQDLPPLESSLFTGPEQLVDPHPFDQQHIRIDVRIDPEARTVAGNAALQVRPLEPLRQVQLMAADMEIDSVIVSVDEESRRAPFELLGRDSLIVTLVPVAAIDSVTADADSVGAGADSTAPAMDAVPGDADAAAPSESAMEAADSGVSADTAGVDFIADPRPSPVSVAEEVTADTALAVPFTVTVYYSARPEKGLYFVPPYEDEEADRVQVWSQGETDGNRHWFPVFDRPADKLTSELIVTIDSAYSVVSNGVLEDERLNADGTRTWHYEQLQPHSPYLIMLAADDYASVRRHATLSSGQRVPLGYWVLPDRVDDVARTLGQTGDILSFFADYLGVTYPWPKLDQVFVRDFMWGGMENTGAVTYTDRILIDERAALDYDPDNLIAHEIAHQWFGDLVTTAHWSDIWLHEAFATFLESVNTERVSGREEALVELLDNRDKYLRETRDYLRPLVWNRWMSAMDIFDRHAYDKGSWILHMIHAEIGDEVFRLVLERFLTDFRFKAVTTEDFQRTLEDVTGGSFDPFFAQWVYAAGHPELDVRYTHDAANGRLRVVIRQTQDAELVPNTFSFPLTLEIQTLGGAERHTVQISEREHDYTFEVDMPPRFVLPDPDLILLADISVMQPASAWVSQLRYALEPASRILAARALAAFVDQPALLVGLRTALEVEQHPTVRREIVKTIALLPHDAAKEQVLMSASRDERAEVREVAAEGLGTLSGSSAAATRALEMAHQEASYKTQAAAVIALARMGAPEAEAVIRSALITPSFRELIRSAAFKALPYVELPANEVYEIARRHSAAGQPTDARVAAVTYLGVLAVSQDRALERLIDLLVDDSYRVRYAAAHALDSVPDARAVDALEARLSVEPEARIQERIRRSMQTLRQTTAVKPEADEEQETLGR